MSNSINLPISNFMEMISINDRSKLNSKPIYNYKIKYKINILDCPFFRKYFPRETIEIINLKKEYVS